MGYTTVAGSLHLQNLNSVIFMTNDVILTCDRQKKQQGNDFWSKLESDLGREKGSQLWA